MFSGFCKLQEQRRTGKNYKKIKANQRKIQWKGRRARTPPSLGFWPKLGSSTAVPRSLLLPGSTGVSMGRRGSREHTPTSWDPRMKKKASPPIQGRPFTPGGDGL